MKALQMFLMMLAGIAVFGTLFWSWDDGTDMVAIDVIKQVAAGGLVAGVSATISAVLFMIEKSSRSHGLQITALLFAVPGTIFGFMAGTLYERHELEVFRERRAGVVRAVSAPLAPSASPATTSR